MFKSMLLAGVAVAGLGGIAAADPPCDPPQPTYGTYQNGSYEANGYYPAANTYYGDGDADDYDRATDESYREASTYATEPAAGTYQNGYVWVAGAYTYPNGVAVWVPAHWQRVAPAYTAPVVTAPVRVVVQPHGWDRGWHHGRTARSYRWRSRW